MPAGFEVIDVVESFVIAVIIIRQDVLDVICIAFALTVNIDVELRRISHFHIHIGREASKEMEHISSGELIQAELCNAVDTGVHSPKRSHQSHSNRSAILIPDFLHHAEQKILVRIPVYLSEVKNTNRSKVVHELRDHLDLPVDIALGIIIAHG